MRALAAMSLLLLSSCLEMEQTITLAADGSGAQQLRLAMSEKVVDEVKRAMTVIATDGAPSPFLVFDEKAVKKELTDAGLQLQAYKSTNERQRRQVELSTTFANVAALRRSPLLGPRCEWEFAKATQPGQLKISLYPQGKAAWVASRAQAEKLATEGDAIAADFFRKRQAQLSGLDVKIRLVLPGRVLQWSKTLEHTGDCEVTATVKAEQINTPEDLVRKLAPRYVVIIDGDGVTLPIDGK